MSAINRKLLVDFATWLSSQEELDVDTPEHAVDLFLEAREVEVPFLVDGHGYWWAYRADVDCWVCAVDPEEALDAKLMAEAVENVLARSGRVARASVHRGLDDGAALVAINFDGIVS